MLVAKSSGLGLDFMLRIGARAVRRFVRFGDETFLVSGSVGEFGMAFGDLGQGCGVIEFGGS